MVKSNAIATGAKGVITRDALQAELNISSPETIREWERAGMPTIRCGKLVFYYVPSIVKWLAAHQGRNSLRKTS